MVLRWVPAKTECGVEYLEAVGEPTAAQEEEMFAMTDGAVAFTSVDARSDRIKRKKPQEEQQQEVAKSDD